MKAILVIDEMPNCCTACPFFEFINDYEDDCRTRCNVKFGRINEYGTDVRPKWCPLKPLPKKFDLSEDRRDGTGHIASRVWYRRHQGWNDCLEEILK